MMSKKVIVWPFWAAAVLLAILVVLFYYRDNRNYKCQGCHSRLVKNQARIGIWTEFSFPIFPVSAEERPSNLYRDYLVSGHTHDWVFAQGSPYYGVFGWGGCAVGSRKRTGNLAYLYEKEPSFRTFVRNKQADGKLTSSDFVAACLLPQPETYSEKGYLPMVDPTYLERESPEVQRLRGFATALEKEFSPP